MLGALICKTTTPKFRNFFHDGDKLKSYNYYKMKGQKDIEDMGLLNLKI